MTKTTILLTLATILASASLQAATINWGNGGGRGHMFVLADGATRVAAGSLIEVGFYASASDPTSAFTLFGTTTMGDPGVAPNNIGGHIPGTGKSIVSALADGNATFQGKAFAIRVYNTATVASATQMGIFTSALWTTPGDPGFNDSSDAAAFKVGVASGVNDVAASALDPGANWDNGSFRIGTVTVGAGANNSGSIFQLGAAVPEPTSFTLAGLAVLGLIAKRRRNA